MVGTRSSARLRTGGEQTKESSKTSSRARVPPPKTTRHTRQTRSATAAKDTEPSTSSTRGTGNIARRGARPSDTRSVASIATSIVGDSDYDQSSEVDSSEGDLHEDTVHQQNAPTAEAMVKLRTNLYEAAKQLHAHLCIEHRDQTWHSLLGAYRSVFNTWKAQYSPIRTLFLDRTPQDVAAVSHTVSAANLVTLMDSIEGAASKGEDALHLFRILDNDFPRCIMAPESAISSSYDEHKTFNRALEIRISLWILQIGANDALTKEAAMELGSILLFDVSGDVIYPDQIDSKTIDFRPIDGAKFDEPDTEDDDQRKMREDIFRTFEHVHEFMANGEVDIKGLQEAFLINTCLDNLFHWAKSLFSEVVKTTERESARPTSDTQGGAAGPQDTIYKGISSIRSLARAMRDPPAMAGDAGPGKRPRDGDAGEGDTHNAVGGGDGEEDEDQGPESKRLKRRSARIRPTHDAESTRADDWQRPDDARSRVTHTPGERVSPPPIHPEGPAREMRRPQKRVFWDSHDEKVLKILVSTHGCFWGRMEKRARDEGLFSSERTQQQIRDKARNMKVRMLRNDERLPHKFDDVALGDKERRLVIKDGKNPDRMEGDLDEDGYPVNTEYLADVEE